MQGVRKHKVNTDYFEKWSHEMSYVLGFISADGNVYKRTLSVEVNPKDRDVIEHIRNQVSPDSVIEDRTNKTRLRVNSVELVKSLVRFSVIPNKSRTIRVNFEVPAEFLGDYIRGVFDGDGGVYARRNSIETCFASASKGFLDDLKSLSMVGGSIFEKEDPRGNRSKMYVWCLYKKDSLALRDLMYSSQGFSLKRKKEVFFSNFYTPSSIWWTDQEIKFLLENKDRPHKWLAEQLSKTAQAVNLKKWRLSHVG